MCWIPRQVEERVCVHGCSLSDCSAELVNHRKMSIVDLSFPPGAVARVALDVRTGLVQVTAGLGSVAKQARSPELPGGLAVVNWKFSSTGGAVGFSWSTSTFQQERTLVQSHREAQRGACVVEACQVVVMEWDASESVLSDRHVILELFVSESTDTASPEAPAVAENGTSSASLHLAAALRSAVLCASEASRVSADPLAVWEDWVGGDSWWNSLWAVCRRAVRTSPEVAARFRSSVAATNTAVRSPEVVECAVSLQDVVRDAVAVVDTPECSQLGAALWEAGRRTLDLWATPAAEKWRHTSWSFLSTLQRASFSPSVGAMVGEWGGLFLTSCRVVVNDSEH
jgi:hypothetical protein